MYGTIYCWWTDAAKFTLGYHKDSWLAQSQQGVSVQSTPHSITPTGRNTDIHLAWQLDSLDSHMPPPFSGIPHPISWRHRKQETFKRQKDTLLTAMVSERCLLRYTTGQINANAISLQHSTLVIQILKTSYKWARYFLIMWQKSMSNNSKYHFFKEMQLFWKIKI